MLAQRPAVTHWTPVTDYSFAARKAIEGRHPQLILETFQPRRILDVGCGPGHLVTLLNEAAGQQMAYGCDVNDQHADYFFDITLSPVAMLPKGWDLVICREVLEHLTIRQIRQAVTRLCALTVRYVYLTTRFHPQPNGLMDVKTHDELDPTHITMLNQDFLRMLFVLEGFKRRADLETRMDWKKLGRVLVYERV